MLYCCLETAYPSFEAQLPVSQSASSCYPPPLYFSSSFPIFASCSLICEEEEKLYLL